MRTNAATIALTAAIALTGCTQTTNTDADRPAQAETSSEATANTPSSTPNSAANSGTARALQKYYDQEITWNECEAGQCGTVTVPARYENPDGPSITLNIVRIPSTGTPGVPLLVNPGGPGGNAVEYAAAAEYIVTPEVLAKYDIVGVDPRGVGRTPLVCLTDEQRDQIIAVDGSPDTPQETQTLISNAEEVTRSCADAAATYGAVSTTATARDMDIVRAALGTETLNYIGKSYGTSIGAQYAELFPERVGRVALDGALPPSLTLEEASWGQAQGFEDALNNFTAECSRSPDCPWSGTGAEVRSQLLQFAKELDSAPLRSGAREVNEGVLMYTILSYLYFPPADYESLKQALALAVEDDPQMVLDLLDLRLNRSNNRYLDNSIDAFLAVTCTDSPTTTSAQEAQALAAEWENKAPAFGASMAWGMLSCAGWPQTEAPAGPSRAEGASPILVVSTTHDPATPHQWGQLLASQIQNSALLTWDAHQHTAYMMGSRCIDTNVDAYLLNGTLPKAGTVCRGRDQ